MRRSLLDSATVADTHRSLRHLVLVGGGHAHVQVLRSLASEPLRDVRVSLVVDQPVAIYSGMVPAFVAGAIAREPLEIDLRALARSAGAELVLAAATGIDVHARHVALGGRDPIAYDVASFDVGSRVAGLEVPGARDFAIATRPIGRFVDEAQALAARVRAGGGARIAVVGGGAAGVELALALRARMAFENARSAEITLVDAGPRVLGEYAPRVSRRARRALERRRVALLLGAPVVAVEHDRLLLEDRKVLGFDALVWATGAASEPLFLASDVATDERGFVRVRPSLQLVDECDVFAAGDCARFEPDLPKAGVYAVRQGPVLAHNLRAHLEGRPLHTYRPQRDFLALLNLGDGTALGTKWGLAFEGRWVLAWKNRIDRAFVRQFQVGDRTRQ